MKRQTLGSILSTVGLIFILIGIYSLVYFESKTYLTNVFSIAIFLIGVTLLFAGFDIELREDVKNDNRKGKFLERMGKRK